MNKAIITLAIAVTAALGISTWALVTASRDGTSTLTARLQAGQRQMQALQRQLGRDEAALAASQARVAGGHRDLITCGDLQSLLNGLSLTVSGTDSLGGQVSGSAYSQGTPLPPHCINQ